ncbi:hypothetical protein AB0B50_13800 [Streptomyces sp. NPDC041068]|uniref:hypothetical protein n=1 Tax=Streptomyces sp. NPDC041068 TaxID=3155130 RepID=UPI0033D311C5
MTEHALRSPREQIRPLARRQTLPFAPRQTPPPARQQSPSPVEAEQLRPLTRCQITDRFQDLGELYAANSGTEPWQWDELGHAFLRRLRYDMRRPGFALLVAEDPLMTACAYGFPVRARLFAIREIVVPPGVRRQHFSREWNLARRLQRRLLCDHGNATGITVVARSDRPTLDALRSWGWRDVAVAPRGVQPCDPYRVLVLDP